MANEFKVKNGIKFPDNTIQTTAATAGSAFTGGSVTSDILNSAAYSAPNNASGAGTKVLIRGSTGTGAASNTGGNGHVEILGGGAISPWLGFTGGTFVPRRGGILLQSGTAQGDAGNTYLIGSNAEIFAGSGGTNGTVSGAGGRIFLQSGNTIRTDNNGSNGSIFQLLGGTNTGGGSFGISGGTITYGVTDGSSGGGGISATRATVTQASDVTVIGGSYTTGSLQSYNSNTGGQIRLMGATATTGGDILFYPGVVAGITGGTNGQVKIDNYVVLHANNYSSYALPLTGGTLTGAVTSGSTYTSTNNANVDGSNYVVDTINKSVALYAYDVRRSGSTVGGILVGGAGAFATGTTVEGNIVLHAGNYTTYPVTEWYHSGRDFVNGTLITTSIDYSGFSGDPFVLQIKGNSYGSQMPLDIQVQGYIYSDTIINYGGYSTGPNFTIIAMNVGGKLCFWFARQTYWQGFNVNCYTAYATRAINKVESITDVANPGGTKQVSITPSQVLRSDNYTNYSPSLTGSGASGTWGISISGNAATATSAGSITDNSVTSYFRITNTSGFQRLLLGNQDSSGANFPAIIRASNGSINFGNGDSWTTSGGVFTSYASFSATAVNILSAIQQNGFQVLNASNYTSYSPGLTGSGASGTWAINISGNAANGGVTSVNGQTGAVTISGGGGGVTGVTATAPVVSSGGTAPVISMAAASSGVNGYMTGAYATKLDGIAAGATAVTNTNQLTNGAGYITSSGTAANVSGTVAIGNGGTGTTSRQDAMDILAGAVTSGQYLRGNGTDVVMSAIQAADVPTLNQNTTGSAGSITDNNVASYLRITNTSGFQRLLIGNQDGTGTNFPAIIRASNGNINFGNGDSWTTNGGVFTSYASFSATAVNILSAIQQNGFQVLNASNYTSYAPSLTGTGASGTWSISITGGLVSSARINPRTSTTGSAATIDPNIASFDQYNLTAQAAALTINAPIGTPVDGNKLTFRILDNGTARAITWNATYVAIGVALPATTVASKTTYIGCVYNANNTRWDVIAVGTQA